MKLHICVYIYSTVYQTNNIKQCDKGRPGNVPSNLDISSEMASNEQRSHDLSACKERDKGGKAEVQGHEELSKELSDWLQPFASTVSQPSSVSFLRQRRTRVCCVIGHGACGASLCVPQTFRPRVRTNSFISDMFQRPFRQTDSAIAP